MSHSPSTGLIFAGRGQVISRRPDLEVDPGSRFGTNTKLFRGVFGPISKLNDYLSAADSMMLLACAGAAETMPCQDPRGKAFINLLQFSPSV